MKRILSLLLLLFILPVEVYAQPQIQPGIPVNSFADAVPPTVSTGTAFSVPQARSQVFTWTTSFSIAPNSITVLLEGSINNGANWFTVDTSTAVAGEIRSFGPVALGQVRCRVSAVNVGSADGFICRINLLGFQQNSIITGGTLTTDLNITNAASINCLTGTITVSDPCFTLTQTWNNAGTTFIGSSISITNTASAAASRLFEVKGGAVGSTDFFYVRTDGTVFVPSSAVNVVGAGVIINNAAGYASATRGGIFFSADGVIELLDVAGTSFNRLQFGGTTSAFPSLKRNAAAINFRLADDSADAAITALSTSSSSSQSVTAGTLGSCIQTLTSTATNDDPTECTRQNRITTTGNTPTTIETITIPASTTVGITCYVVNRRTGGASGTPEDGAYYRIEVAMKNVTGTATEIAAETLVVIGESIAGYTVTAAPSGATELIQVTGAATTDITWHSTCRTYNVGS